MQQNGPKNLGFFGTRNMGFLHQNLIEILSYAMVLTVRSCCAGARLTISRLCTCDLRVWKRSCCGRTTTFTPPAPRGPMPQSSGEHCGRRSHTCSLWCCHRAGGDSRRKAASSWSRRGLSGLSWRAEPWFAQREPND